MNKELIARAILRGDETYTENKITITLPKGQSAGTETQKLFYARKKADEIVKGAEFLQG